MADWTFNGLWIWLRICLCILCDFSAIRVMSSSRLDETVGACSSISRNFKEEKSDNNKVREKHETSHRSKNSKSGREKKKARRRRRVCVHGMVIRSSIYSEKKRAQQPY